MAVKKLVSRNSISCRLVRGSLKFLSEHNFHTTIVLFVLVMVSLFNRDYVTTTLAITAYMLIEITLILAGVTLKAVTNKMKKLRTYSDDVVKSSIEILSTPELISDIEMLGCAKEALEDLYEKQRKVTNACIYLCDDVETVDMLTTYVLKTLSPLMAATLNYEVLCKLKEMKK